MNNLDNAAFTPDFIDVLVRLQAGDITEAEASAEALDLINRWYTLPGTMAERMANFLLSISGWIATEGVPSDAVGENGTFAFDTTTGNFYGPKAAGSWGEVVLELKGDSAYQVAVSEGFTGTKAEWLASLVGGKGDAGTLTINEVTTGDAGTDASVENVGSPSAASLNITIPRGDPGEEVSLQATATHIQWRLGEGTWANLVALDDLAEDGADGEEVSLRVEGANIEWRLGEGAWQTLVALSALKGDTGEKGWSPVLSVEADGARRVHRVVGWVGGEGDAPATGSYIGASGYEADIADAVDIRGGQGLEGDPGPAATIAVGTVTTGAPGSSASVTNSGTDEAAVFDIKIPRGDTGATGSFANDFEGAWDSGTAYAAGKIVSYGGETWYAEAASTNVTPGTDGTKWSKLAAKGADGAGAGTVTSVGVGGATGHGITSSGGPITSSGTIELSVDAEELKSHISLDLVDNTSDADKPVSTAQQAALDDKVDEADLGAANGVATLDGDGKLDPDQIPDGIGGGGIAVQALQTSAFTPEAGKAYPCDLSGGGFELTGLPESPSQGDRIELYDPNGSWSETNALTIPGDDGLNGDDVDMTIPVTNAWVVLEYVNANYGWDVKVHDPEDADTYRAATVATPSITSPADDATDIIETPTITGSAFAMLYQSGTHDETDWQIASDSGFSTIVVESLADDSNLESWTVPFEELAVSTTYYVRVRYRTASGVVSDWSDTVSFTTASSFIDPDAQVYIDNVTPTPDPARRQVLSTLFQKLKNGSVHGSNVFDKISLWLFSLHDTSASILNLTSPADAAASKVNDPTVVVDGYIQGDDVSALVDLGIELSEIDGYTLNSAAVGIWFGDKFTEDYNHYKPNPGESRLYFSTDASSGWGLHTSNAPSISGSVTRVNSHIALVRRNSTTFELWRNGVLIGTPSIGGASTSIPTGDIVFGRSRQSGNLTGADDNKYRLFWAGPELSANEMVDLHQALSDFLATLDA